MVNKKNHSAYYYSPLGWIKIQGGGHKIVSVEFTSQPRPGRRVHTSLKPALRQLEEYFRGARRRFSLKLNLAGTQFQKNVWQSLKTIKFGQTTSYQKIASRSGHSRAVRAAASAVGKNRFAIVVPCHRVIASSGELAGYAGGIWRKRWLLDHEKKRA